MARFVVAATAVGLREMLRRLAAAGVGEVAIERPDGHVGSAATHRPGPDLAIG